MRRERVKRAALLLAVGAAAACILVLASGLDGPEAPAPEGREPSSSAPPPSPPAKESREEPPDVADAADPANPKAEQAPEEPPPGILVVRLFHADGRPWTGARLRLERDNPDHPLGVDRWRTGGTREDGTCRFADIPPGRWRIYHPKPKRRNTGVGFHGRILRTVEVPPGTLVSVDVFAPRGGRSLSGHLVWYDPMGGLRIKVLDGDTREVVADGFAVNLCQIGNDRLTEERIRLMRDWERPGWFLVEGLDPRPYVVSVFPSVQLLDLSPQEEERMHPVEIPVDLTTGDVHLPWRVFWPDDFGFPRWFKESVFRQIRKEREEGLYEERNVHAWFPDTGRLE